VRVLFVCLGNICRSPTAEGVLLAMLARRKVSGVDVDSCGTVGHHVGEAPDPRTIAHAKKRGYDLSPLRARQLAPADFMVFDRVYAMDQNNLRHLMKAAPPEHQHKIGLLLDVTQRAGEPAPLQNHGAIEQGQSHMEREVPDPWAGGPADFELVLDLCERACAAIVDGIVASRAA